MKPAAYRAASLVVFALAVAAWLLAVGELCDWGRFRPWWLSDEVVAVEMGDWTRVRRVRSDVPIEAGDRIVSIAGKPYRRGMLARMYRESVPGDTVRIGVAPASGKPPFEVDLTLGESHVQVLPGPAMVLLGGVVFLSWAFLRARDPGSLDSLVKTWLLAQAAWASTLLLIGMYASLPDAMRSAIVWYGLGHLAVLPALELYAIWFFPRPLERRWTKAVAVATALVTVVTSVAGILSEFGMSRAVFGAEALGLNRRLYTEALCMVLAWRWMKSR